MRASLISIFILAVTGLASDALAQSPGQVVSAEAVPSSAASGSAADPHADRVILGPTALTQPRGSISVFDRELLITGLTYGVTDEWQVTVMTVPQPWSPNVGVQSTLRVWEDERMHVGVTGHAGKLWLGYGDSMAAMLASVVATYCLDDECSSLVTGNLGTGKLQARFDGIDEHRLWLAQLGITRRLSRHAKLLLDVHAMYTDDVDNESTDELVVLAYGVRFHSSSVVLDLALLHGIGRSPYEPVEVEHALVPYGAVSYRWD